jgi:hypothetical protein
MTADTATPPRLVRKVGIGLFIGIVCLPWIFSWFTLRQGHSTSSRVLSLGWAAFTLWAVILPRPPISNAVGEPPSTATASAQTTPATATSGSSETTKPTELATKWQYSEDKDAMRGTTTKFATLTSENTVNLDFPYGSHTGDLEIRRRPSDGLNIMLKVEGQFLCSSYNYGHVSVKFDDKPIQSFGCSEPEDASTGLLFIGSEGKFLSEIKKAKNVVIEAPYYQNGRQQLTFDVRGLNF